MFLLLELRQAAQGRNPRAHVGIMLCKNSVLNIDRLGRSPVTICNFEAYTNDLIDLDHHHTSRNVSNGSLQSDNQQKKAGERQEYGQPLVPVECHQHAICNTSLSDSSDYLHHYNLQLLKKDSKRLN